MKKDMVRAVFRTGMHMYGHECLLQSKIAEMAEFAVSASKGRTGICAILKSDCDTQSHCIFFHKSYSLMYMVFELSLYRGSGQRTFSLFLTRKDLDFTTTLLAEVIEYCPCILFLVIWCYVYIRIAVIIGIWFVTGPQTLRMLSRNNKKKIVICNFPLPSNFQ